MNRKQARRYFYVFVVVCVCALLYAAIRFEWRGLELYKAFGTYVLIVMVGWYGINQRWYRSFVKEVQALAPILYQERDHQRYINENLTRLEGKKSMQIVSMLEMNLCAAYCDIGDFKTAKERLSHVNEKKLTGIAKVCYLLNLAYVHFKLGENREALMVLNSCTKDRFRLKNSPTLGPLIGLLVLYELEAVGQGAKALETLPIVRKQWPSIAKDLEELETRLNG